MPKVTLRVSITSDDNVSETELYDAVANMLFAMEKNNINVSDNSIKLTVIKEIEIHK